MEKEFTYPVGRVLLGTVDAVRSAYDRFAAQPVHEVDLCGRALRHLDVIVGFL